jgi:hypothetical protein
MLSPPHQNCVLGKERAPPELRVVLGVGFCHSLLISQFPCKKAKGFRHGLYLFQFSSVRSWVWFNLVQPTSAAFQNNLYPLQQNCLGKERPPPELRVFL